MGQFALFTNDLCLSQGDAIGANDAGEEIPERL